MSPRLKRNAVPSQNLPVNYDLEILQQKDDYRKKLKTEMKEREFENHKNEILSPCGSADATESKHMMHLQDLKSDIRNK